MKTIEELEGEIADLRWQLREYHERLEGALEHNTEFQLNATWGIVHSVLINATWIGGILGFSRAWKWAFAESAPWWAFLVATPLSFLAAGLVGTWSAKGHEDDKKKLWRWPEWGLK